MLSMGPPVFLTQLANVLSREVKTYLYNLLEPYPDNRRTIFQLRKDPWIVRGSFSEATLENPDTTIFTSKINWNPPNC